MDPARVSLAALGLTLLVGCGKDRAAKDDFAAMQERGQQVMGVNQYTSAHVFEDLADGGRVVLERADSADTAAIKTIRAHMHDIATAFRAGDFAKPFQVHAQTVPGTGVMTAKRSAITYEEIDRPRGGEVRIRSTDPARLQRFTSFSRFSVVRITRRVTRRIERAPLSVVRRAPARSVLHASSTAHGARTGARGPDVRQCCRDPEQALLRHHVHS